MASTAKNPKGAGRKKEPGALTKARGNKHLTKDEEAESAANEVYAASGDIEAPDVLIDDATRALFEKEARYMLRVNEMTGCAVYGAEDVELLTAMCLAYQRAIEYSTKESRARSLDSREKYNRMKDKELKLYERFLRTLKLDPSSRVQRPGLGGGDDGPRDIIDIM